MTRQDAARTAVIDARVRLPLELRPAEARTKPPEFTDRYDAVLGVGASRQRTLAELVADMDRAGVVHAVVHAETEFGDHADDLNEATAKLIATRPERFSGFGTVDLTRLRPMTAVRQVRRAAELGLVGINLQPSFFDLPIDERGLYPAYSAATELGLVVAVHTGVNYSRVSAIANERPLLLDRVACDFPDLRLVACHAGWPWVDELVAVMRRHPNVHADFGGLSPKYVGQEGTGWSTLRRYMDSLLSHQVLFATDWPVFPMDRAIREWKQMGLKPTTIEQLFRGNAAALLQRR